MDSKTQTSTQPADAPHAALPPDEGRWSDLLQPRYFATTSMLCIGVALYAFNGFLVTTSLPSAVTEFGGAALISWALTLYLAASIVAGASAALLKQALGSRVTLIVAGMIFLAGTLIAGFATNMGTVLVGRVLQGIGEGIVAAVCYALIPEMFPSNLIAKVFGAEAGVWAAAAFGAPLLAGWLTETISWRAAFLVNVPMILGFMLLALVIAPRAKAAPLKFTLPGLRLALLSIGLMAILVAGISAPRLAAALVALTGLALAATVLLDRRATDSILPSTAFSLRSSLGLSLWVVLLMPVGQATSGVYLVYGLQHVWGLSPTWAGALSALMAVSWSSTAILVANLRRQRHTDMLVWLGPLSHIVGLAALFSAFAFDNLAVVVLAQVIIGAAFGMSWAFVSKLAMETSSAHERDKTSALLPTLQSAGFALGGGLAGLAANSAGLAESVAPADVRSALSLTFLIAVLWALPAVFAARRAIGLARISSRG